MNNVTRSTAGIECVKFLSSFYEDELIVLRNHSEIFDGSYRDIDLFLNKRNSKLDDIIAGSFVSDKNHSLVSFIQRKNFLQLKILSLISMEVFIIDIWDSLEWKGIPYMFLQKDKKEITFTTERGINFFSQKEQLLLAICKCITQTGKIKKKYEDKYINKDLSSDLIEYFNFDYLKIQNTSKLRRFLALSFYSKGNFIKSSIYWFIIFAGYFFKKKGIFIELVGPDGSGKTSLSELLVDKKKFFADSKYFHGRIPILPRISNILQFKKTSPERLQPNSELQLQLHQNTSIKKFTILHIFYYSFDAILSRLKLFFWLRRDQIIVVDRSPYDIYARGDYAKINNLLKKFYVYSHPRPCLRLLLKAKPETINLRKNELTVSEIIHQYSAYENNLKNTSYNEIDTGAGIDIAFQLTVEQLIKL
mgnify:CR=1 FL=1